MPGKSDQRVAPGIDHHRRAARPLFGHRDKAGGALRVADDEAHVHLRRAALVALHRDAEGQHTVAERQHDFLWEHQQRIAVSLPQQRSAALRFKPEPTDQQRSGARKARRVSRIDVHIAIGRTGLQRLQLEAFRIELTQPRDDALGVLQQQQLGGGHAAPRALGAPTRGANYRAGCA